MAKGQHLSRYQQGIVKRYYEHQDTISLTKVTEAATELYLTTDPKKADKLWKSVETALAKLTPTNPRVRRVLETRDVKGLAQLASDLSGKK